MYEDIRERERERERERKQQQRGGLVMKMCEVLYIYVTWKRKTAFHVSSSHSTHTHAA